MMSLRISLVAAAWFFSSSNQWILTASDRPNILIILVDETLSFAKQHPDQPWFVNLWLDDMAAVSALNQSRPRTRRTFKVISMRRINDVAGR